MKEVEIQTDKTRGLLAELTPAYRKLLNKALFLTAEEEKRLALRMVQGDRGAREKLLLSGLKLVLWEAYRYRDRDLPFADIIQEGHIGLLKALDRYDPT